MWGDMNLCSVVSVGDNDGVEVEDAEDVGELDAV